MFFLEMFNFTRLQLGFYGANSDKFNGHYYLVCGVF